jgi:hypothetical protein
MTVTTEQTTIKASSTLWGYNPGKIISVFIGFGCLILLIYHSPNTGLTQGEILIFIMQCAFFVLWGLY